jgi:phosphoribulokinase
MERNQLSFELNQAIQQDGIKKCFEMGGKLTVQDAFHRFSTTELRKIVCRLKKSGLNIVSQYTQANGYRFKEYWLSKE